MYLIVAVCKVPQLQYKCQNDATMEFYLHVLLNSLNSVKKYLFLKGIVRTCILLCKRPRCYHRTNSIQVTEKILN